MSKVKVLTMVVYNNLFVKLLGQCNAWAVLVFVHPFVKITIDNIKPRIMAVYNNLCL